MSKNSSRKVLDLTGRTFGKLTVTGPAENIGNGTAWRCRCECGKETVVATKNLKSGNTKSCGCMRGRWPRRRKLDLTGQEFGRLTVLGPAANIGKHTAWRCRCECGNETVVKTDNLTSGTTRSCGCLVCDTRKAKRTDLTGQKFERLTVLGPAENIGRSTAWRCKCDCGNETVVMSNNLTSGRTRSCGCLAKSHRFGYVEDTAGA